MKTFAEFTLTEATTMPTWGEMNKTPAQKAIEAQHKAFEKSASQARVMPTFAELAKKRAAGMTEEEIVEFLSKLFGPKKVVPPTPTKNKKNRVGYGDMAYRTDHHYGGGDIDPKTVPIFKPSWQTAGR